jgi:hypothetical protein
VQKIIGILTAFILVYHCLPAFAVPEMAPDRVRGEGPFDRLILRGVVVISGEGAPPIGPMDVVIEGNRIVSIHNAGNPGLPRRDACGNKRPKTGLGEMERCP